MPEEVTEHLLDVFISNLQQEGGKAGNVTLRHRLRWNEDLYWEVQGQLIERGRISSGRGRGGSVRLPDTVTPTESDEATPEMSEIADTHIALATRERNLYSPLKRGIESKWIKRFGYDEVYVEETHSRGSRETGGTFTRPDLTAAGIRRYLYLPKRLEIVTFEIKPANAVSIMGVLEALAHKEAAHRAYVLFPISRETFDTATESDRILELSQKYGIGLVLTELPEEVDTWEVILEAIRHEPDPARLDRFLADLPNEAMKNRLAKWKD